MIDPSILSAVMAATAPDARDSNVRADPFLVVAEKQRRRRVHHAVAMGSTAGSRSSHLDGIGLPRNHSKQTTSRGVRSYQPYVPSAVGPAYGGVSASDSASVRTITCVEFGGHTTLQIVTTPRCETTPPKVGSDVTFWELI